MTEYPATDEAARHAILEFARRDPEKVLLIGAVAIWLRSARYSFDYTERLLENLVAEGVLRHATSAECAKFSIKHGYFVTAEGKRALPPGSFYEEG